MAVSGMHSTCAIIFLFVDTASLWRAEIVIASLPEVNQFTGNCFRVVRIVLKITFLELRYPGQRPECPSLSYYGSCLDLCVFSWPGGGEEGGRGTPYDGLPFS